MITKIETITVTRPMKVIAFTCCTFTTFILVAACASSEWIITEGWREGLFDRCVSTGAPTPLPFNTKKVPGCRSAHSAGYIKAVAALIILTCFTDFFGALLTGLGLRSTDPNKKYKYYRIAIYSLIICVLALFLSLIIYPVSFYNEIESENGIYDGKRVQTYFGSIDFDKDGIMDYEDMDDDNDGIPDVTDPDDDNDGIPDHKDPDDDNDGIPDEEDNFGEEDSDGDGVVDALDNDDDNDGVIDALDNDDDNDGIPDVVENRDSDGDGVIDTLDNDDDNDGVVDALDNDDDNDGIIDSKENNLEDLDTDGDGIVDSMDPDDDNDGIYDVIDDDDNNNGIPDDEDVTGHRRTWSFGFSYGSCWASLLLILMSLVLLICDRESEEIFYKEKELEDEKDELEEA